MGHSSQLASDVFLSPHQELVSGTTAFPVSPLVTIPCLPFFLSVPRSPITHHGLLFTVHSSLFTDYCLYDSGKKSILALSDASIKAVKSGCGSRGRDLNSGWNWQPRNHG